MGVDVNAINPKNIRLFHNGGGLLPVVAGDMRPDDLVEIPIIIYGESDGRFDDGDLIVFYARGPVTWRYNANEPLLEVPPLRMFTNTLSMYFALIFPSQNILTNMS